MTNERIRIGEAITLEYPPGIIGFLRCLTDPTHSPGDVEWSCAIVENDTHIAVNIFCGKRVPSQKEIDELTDYFTARGFSEGTWYRFKNGKKRKRVIIKQSPVNEILDTSMIPAA